MLVELKRGLLNLRRSPCGYPPFLIPPTSHKAISFRICATVNSGNGSIEGHHNLTAKERRQLRNSSRESKAGTHNWREEVEQRLIKKPKKRGSWTDEQNLDTLALLGPQWWIVRVSRMAIDYTSERLARLLAQRFPYMDFKVYAPSVQIKKKLKNGTISVKPKPLFPGCVFLWCVLNKDVHDFIRKCEGVGGFVGVKLRVGNTKRQINRPRPVDAEDMVALQKRVKQEQDQADKAFIEEHPELTPSEFEKLNLDPHSDSILDVESNTSVKARGRPRKATKPVVGVPLWGSDVTLPLPGSTVQVVSGAFAGYSGILKKFDSNTGLVTVSLTLFGKETFADLHVNEIVAETN